MAKIYPPTSGMKGQAVELYLYEDDQSSSIHRIFCPPLPVYNHLEPSKAHTVFGQRPSMLGASQLKALLSPGRRPKTTNDADEEDNISLSDLIEPEPEVVASTTALPRTRRRGGKKDAAVQKMYYNLPQSKNRPSESTRSPRVRQTRNI